MCLIYKNKFTCKKPIKSKTNKINSSFGRNNKGRITAWHRGGGHKKLFRNIDLYREKTNGIVVKIEYDPNRTAQIARIYDPDKRITNYILAPDTLVEGDIIRSLSDSSDTGHSQKLRYIATGTIIYNISLRPLEYGKILRAGGAYGILIKKIDQKAQIQLKSGCLRWFPIDATASIGSASTPTHKNKKKNKAGYSRWLGRRPTVRGVAMNPIDHPHGGGEGKTSGGRPSVTPWGKPTRGRTTKKN